MIYVSHRLDEIFRIADRVAVLRDGMMVGIRDVAHTTPEELVQLIVGRRAREFDRPEADKGASVLSLSNVVIGDVGPVDLKVNQGEVVGLLGLRGAGHEDVGRCLFGERAFTGDIALNGKAPDLSSTTRGDAIGYRVAGPRPGRGNQSRRCSRSAKTCS